MKFKPNRNFERQMQESPGMRAELVRNAEKAKRAAIASVNRDSGDYQQRFEIVATGDGVVLANTDFAAHIIEWGSVENPPQAPIRRGVRAAGMRLDEIQK